MNITNIFIKFKIIGYKIKVEGNILSASSDIKPSDMPEKRRYPFYSSQLHN
jgi:hypothetical protein